MRTKNSNIITGIIFCGLLIGTAIMQTHLKSKPQIFMLIIGFLTVLSIILRKKTLSTILFYIVLGIMLYVNYFMIANSIIDLLNPNRGLVEVNGQTYAVMDTTWRWAVASGLILSPLTIFLYHKSKLRRRLTEVWVSALFLISTIAIYIIYELC